MTGDPGGVDEAAKVGSLSLRLGLDEAPEGYQDFDQGAAKKYVLGPHGMVRGRG